MKAYTFSLGLLLASINLSLASPASPRSADSQSSWYLTCWSPRLNDDYYGISAWCSDWSGNPVYSGMNLDQCLGNYNGNLVCSNNGRYSVTCQDCALYASQVWCNCLNDTGNLVHAQVDTGDCVENINGHLSCYGHLN